jgi:hypothetical protein
MSLVTEQHLMRNPRAVLHWYDFLMPVLLHRTESKRGPSAAWFSSGRTDIPEIHLEIPHGGISEKLNVLFIPSSGIPRRRLLDSRRWLDSSLTPKDVSAIRHDEVNKYSAVFLAELPNEGRYVARVIRSRVLGLKPPAPFWYWDKSDLAIVGRTYAVADIRFLRFAGFPAWVVWAVVHIYFLIGFANRFFVLLLRHKAPADPHPDQPSRAMKNPAENW